MNVLVLLACAALPVLPTPAALTVAARAALDTDPGTAGAAIATLRAAGPAGLDAFLAIHGAELPATANAGDPRAAALDAICAQRHCAASHLFWFTDLDAARAEARRTGRPILSLRLLGRLDEDASCANSRYFRTLLYSDPAIADVLRSRFVLHWQSARPIPRVTIDYGDGRREQRTITGNSVHLVLDTDGAVVDAIPGLYAPAVFLRHVEDAARFAATISALPKADRAARVQERHANALVQIARIDGANQAEAPALSADRLAMTKSLVERPLLKAVAGAPGPDTRVVSAPPVPRAALSANARAFVVAEAQRRGADPARMLADLRRTLARDTDTNESLRLQVHAGLASGAPTDPDAFTSWVYANVFRAPLEDPTMGLTPSTAFLALDASSREADEH